MTLLQSVCGNCSKEIGDVTFCPFCGLPQQCVNCGTKFESDERFCGNCGTKRENPVEQAAQETEEVDEQKVEEVVTSHIAEEEVAEDSDNQEATESAYDEETSSDTTEVEATESSAEQHPTEKSEGEEETESVANEEATENKTRDETSESVSGESSIDGTPREPVIESTPGETVIESTPGEPAVENPAKKQVAASAKNVPSTQQGQAPQGEQEQPIFKKPPFIIGAIVIIGIIIAYFSGGFANDEKKIEKTIHTYMDAVGEFDFDKVEKIHHPHSPYIDDLNDFTDFPFDIEIEVHRIYDIDVYDDYADAIVLMSVSSSSFGDERYTDEVYVELEKYKRKWYIYDIY